MAILNSEEFKGDTALEACATQDPAHIMPGASGPHVRKIQDALNRLDNAGIAGAEYQGMKYGTATTTAVANFKTKRKILNYAGRIDSIVGIKTIRALDQELRDLGKSLENAVDPTTYVDIIVRFIGGAEASRNSPSEATARLRIPNGYATRNRTIYGIARGADARLASQARSVCEEILRVRKTTPSGLLCIRGSSLGGIWAMELAQMLTLQNIYINFLSLQDAAFSTRDAINSPILVGGNTPILVGAKIDNTPLFASKTSIIAQIRVSHYQRIGNAAENSFRKGGLIWASAPGALYKGEIHGQVVGFLPDPCDPTDYHKDHPDLAHSYCCREAETKDLRVISDLLTKVCMT